MSDTATVLDFDMTLRAAAAEGLVQRMQFARQMGQSFGGQRDMYTILGYNRELTLEDLRERYDRGGIAGRIVDALPNATWRGGVELIEDNTSENETPFEAEWNAAAKKHRLVSKMLRADILSGISSFAVLLIGAPGSLETPLPNGKPGGLLYVTPYCGAYVTRLRTNGQRGIVSTTVAEALSSRGSGDVIVSEFDDKTESDRFGQPLFYELRRTSFDPDLKPRRVHWTRVVHVAESLDDDLFAASKLERPWNLLDDLMKVTGGGAEAFFQRANQGRNVKVDKDIKTTLDEVEKSGIREQLELLDLGYGKNVFTRGIDVNTFGSDVANFNGPADAILTQLAGTTCIPKRILTGSEMGELASSQDRENWKDQVNGRRDQYAGPSVLERLADRLIEYGYLSTPKNYAPRWGTILNVTLDEKLKGLSAWCAARTDEGPAFTLDEIRASWADKLPLDDDQLEKLYERLQALSAAKQSATPQDAATQPPDGEV